MIDGMKKASSKRIEAGTARGSSDGAFEACRCQEGSPMYLAGGMACRRLREGDETRRSATTLLGAALVALENGASTRPGWPGRCLPLLYG